MLTRPARLIGDEVGVLRRGCVALVMASLLVSCAPSPLSDDWIETRPLAQSTPTWRPARLTTDESRGDTLPRTEAVGGELTLHQAIALALLHSPDLATFAYGVRAAEARAIQAGLPPNPRLRVGAENLGGPDAGDTFLRSTVVLSQVIELAGKRQKRLALADAEQRLAAWDYEARRLRVVTDVTRRYIAVVAAQQRIELAERNLRLAEQVHDIVDQRAEAGMVPTSARDKAAVRVSVERIELDRLTHQHDAARQTLAASWAGAAPGFDQAAGTLQGGTELPDKGVLLSRARDHPRLARWADEIEQRRRAVDLARASGVPDLTVGAGVRYFPDAEDAAAVVELALPLPLFDRNQGRVLETRYALAQAGAQQRSAEAALGDELTRAYAEAESSAFAMRALGDQALPAARSAFEAEQSAYRIGKTDYLNVLDAERTMVDVERQLIDANESFHASVASLEGLTAAPLTSYP